VGQAIVFRGLPRSSGAQTTNNDRLRHAWHGNEYKMRVKAEVIAASAPTARMPRSEENSKKSLAVSASFCPCTDGGP